MGVGAELNQRVRSLLREVDSRDASVDTIEIDRQIEESAMVISALLPEPYDTIENAFTIGAGSPTFILPGVPFGWGYNWGNNWGGSE